MFTLCGGRWGVWWGVLRGERGAALASATVGRKKFHTHHLLFEESAEHPAWPPPSCGSSVVSAALREKVQVHTGKKQQDWPPACSKAVRLNTVSFPSVPLFHGQKLHPHGTIALNWTMHCSSLWKYVPALLPVTVLLHWSPNVFTGYLWWLFTCCTLDQLCSVDAPNIILLFSVKNDNKSLESWIRNLENKSAAVLMWHIQWCDVGIQQWWVGKLFCLLELWNLFWQNLKIDLTNVAKCICKSKFNVSYFVGMTLFTLLVVV